MKRFAMMLVGAAVLSASTGCCCLFPWCGSSGACGYQQPYMQQQPCSPCSPYGSPYGAAVAPTSAYYPGTSLSAGISIGPTYAAGPYPVMATAPVNVLPTY